jgi:N-acetylglucosamine-6-phosphate deacetylase
MNMLAITNGRIFDGEAFHDGMTVLMENGRITEVSNRSPVNDGPVHDLEGRLLAPGFIDLQVNGGGGVMFNDAPTVATLRTMAAAHRCFGTIGLLPTLISSPRETMHEAVEAVRRAIEEDVPGILGIHLEGPFLARERRGIHDEGQLRPIGADDLDWLCSLNDLPVLLTVAPEAVGSDAIRRLAGAGLTVFGGHSAASYAQTRAALDAGLTGFTHLFNAMAPFGQREPGIVGAALEDRKSYAGLIADGSHVHPAALAVAAAAKSPDRIVLVTDAMATVGAPGARFDWNGQPVSVSDGSCRLPDGSLAGSNLDMLGAVRNAMRYMRVELAEALRMASANPAAAIGLDHELGHVRPGYRASLVELDDALDLHGGWIDGRRFDAAGKEP